MLFGVHQSRIQCDWQSHSTNIFNNTEFTNQRTVRIAHASRTRCKARVFCRRPAPSGCRPAVRGWRAALPSCGRRTGPCRGSPETPRGQSASPEVRSPPTWCAARARTNTAAAGKRRLRNSHNGLLYSFSCFSRSGFAVFSCASTCTGKRDLPCDFHLFGVFLVSVTCFFFLMGRRVSTNNETNTTCLKTERRDTRSPCRW